MHLWGCVGCARKSLRVGRKACGGLLFFAALASIAVGAPPLPTPEIDPGSLASALALVTGGGRLLSERFRRR